MYIKLDMLKVHSPFPAECCCLGARTLGSRPKKEATSRADYDKVICSMSERIAGPTFGRKRHKIYTAKKSLWAASGLEALWVSVSNSDLMSCKACQEQHLQKRCLSDGQKCAGTNTDSMHTGRSSILKSWEIISLELKVFLGSTWYTRLYC